MKEDLWLSLYTVYIFVKRHVCQMIIWENDSPCGYILFYFWHPIVYLPCLPSSSLYPELEKGQIPLISSQKITEMPLRGQVAHISLMRNFCRYYIHHASFKVTYQNLRWAISEESCYTAMAGLSKWLCVHTRTKHHINYDTDI